MIENKRFIGDLNLNELMKMRVYFVFKEDILSLIEEMNVIIREDFRIKRIFIGIKEWKNV